MGYSFIKDPVFMVPPMAQVAVIEAPKAPWPNAKLVSSLPASQAFNIPNEEEYKKLFGTELAKSPNNAFDAACRIFADTKIALWVSRNWLDDAVVIAAKDIYAEKSKSSKQLLSKEELAEKVLDLAEDAFLEGKDRIAALKLYSEIAGYTGKVEIDASTKNFLTRNEMKVVFVKADNEQKEIKEQPKVIEHEEQSSPIKIKLVK